MNKRAKESLNEKCNRLEAEIKILKRKNVRLDKQIALLREQKLRAGNKNLALQKELFTIKSKQTRRIEDIIAESDEESAGGINKSSDKDS
ncbi:MAG: hypothetical protein HND39_12065 [Ignavibacteriota bacterium]|jgi:hypothetical protein|uniref:hypothetical protein n=1 Tax=Ignavibacterium album TaxID=591197 RepID=UPI0015984DEC|nr:hypothetical protein [Ignavibacteriota bacterium]QKJ96953.1 MAG: hypothetical protein HND39_12065 [Ignavibacteriota bacterium]GIK60430.1 MAG: hypothetical protein BroJett017_13200 [Ignavibacteriota bacterium]